ncbi:MAG: hypothetical protein P4L45_08760 [Ignavibacteriaceae bacterium]|nr:hypothetical protein [Ignavibacteriaceae bacterium]
MTFQVKVKVKADTIKEFAKKLMKNQLDRSAIVSETYCEKDDPSTGISFWQAGSKEEFERKFSAWEPYYENIEIKEVITAKEAMLMLFNK